MLVIIFLELNVLVSIIFITTLLFNIFIKFSFIFINETMFC